MKDCLLAVVFMFLTLMPLALAHLVVMMALLMTASALAVVLMFLTLMPLVLEVVMMVL